MAVVPVAVPREKPENEEEEADDEVPVLPPPERWTIVDDLIWGVATYLDPVSIVRMGAVNWRFRNAIDDTVWRELCNVAPEARNPERPFPSFQHYYRAVKMLLPTGDGEGLYGPTAPGVISTGNIIQRERTASFGDTFFPIVRIQRHDHCELLLLDRAEHIFVGIAASSAATTARVLERPGSHHLYVVPYCLPGTLLTCRTVPNADGDGQRLVVARRIHCNDNILRESTVVDAPLPAATKDWTFAVGLGAHGASFSALELTSATQQAVVPPDSPGKPAGSPGKLVAAVTAPRS